MSNRLDWSARSEEGEILEKGKSLDKSHRRKLKYWWSGFNTFADWPLEGWFFSGKKSPPPPGMGRIGFRKPFRYLPVTIEINFEEVLNLCRMYYCCCSWF